MEDKTIAEKYGYVIRGMEKMLTEAADRAVTTDNCEQAERLYGFCPLCKIYKLLDKVGEI